MIMIGAGIPCRDLTDMTESQLSQAFGPCSACSACSGQVGQGQGQGSGSGSQLIKGMNHQAAFIPSYSINRQCMMRKIRVP
jgi:hypothetical protein